MGLGLSCATDLFTFEEFEVVLWNDLTNGEDRVRVCFILACVSETAFVEGNFSEGVCEEFGRGCCWNGECCLFARFG